MNKIISVFIATITSGVALCDTWQAPLNMVSGVSYSESTGTNTDYNALSNRPIIGSRIVSGTHPITYYGGLTSESLNGYATETWVGQQGYLTSVSWSDVSGKPTFATVAISGSYNDLMNKPTIPAAQIQANWTETDTSSKAFILNKPTLATVATSGAYSDLSGKPTLATVATSGNYSDLSGRPTLATVATSGSYNDLSNRPTIPAGQIQSDWNQTNTSALDYIKNKPSIPEAQVNSDWNATSGKAQILNKPTIPSKTSDLTNDSGFLSSVSWSEVSGKPTFATVATSGSYNDLLNKPTIPAAQVNADWNAVSGISQILNKPALATVATSGSYNDLNNKPSIPTTYLKSASSTDNSITVTKQDNTTVSLSVNYEYSTRTVSAPSSITAVSGEIVSATGINGTLNVVFPAEVTNESAMFIIRIVATGASQLGTLTITGGGTVTPEYLCDSLTKTGAIKANKTTYLYFYRVATNTYCINALEVK